MNYMNTQNPSLVMQDAQIEASNAFLRRIYQWMTAGLIITAIVAHVVASSPAILSAIFSSRFTFFGLIVVELGLVMAISWGINRISAAAAMGCFVLYSLINGATLSVVLLVYTRESVASAFFSTAGMFGVMSVYGLRTKKDLSSWSSFLMMGLFGIIIAGIVNMFMRSGPMELVISVIAVIIFLGLTAYDTQKFRNLGATMELDGADEMPAKIAIVGALALYLDFVNLFIHLLRIMGRRR